MKKRGPKVLKQSHKSQYELDVVLPVYNERESIAAVLREWDRELSRHVRYRFIICEDGSTDGTKELLQELAHSYLILLNQKKERRGYSRAALDGIRTSTAPYILCIDSDGQCDASDFFSFWKKRQDGKILIGWRTRRMDIRQRTLLSFLFKSLFTLLFPTTLHDPSAPFVLLRKSVIRPYVHELGYLREGFWWGFVGMCVKYGLALDEIPIHHRPRISGATNVYRWHTIPQIAVRNLVGLIRLRLS